MSAEVFLGLAVLLLLLWKLCKKPAGLPPGPWGIPLIGHLPLNVRHIDDHLSNLQKQHGDMYIWRLGTQVMLFVHDYHLTKQIFGCQNFADRPNWEFFKSNQETALGVAFSNGDVWHTNRKFSIRQLRNFGMGKSGMCEAIHAQALILVESIRKGAGKPQVITPALNTAILNVIWQMVANKQFEKDDPRLVEFQKIMKEFVLSASSLVVPDFFPWMKAILPTPVVRKLFNMDTFDMVTERFSAYFRELIKEHQAVLDPDDPKDLIDAYLLEMEEMKSESNSSLRSEKDLTILIFALFFGGSDTVTNTLKWIFLYMAAHPEVQSKLQEEIDLVLPRDVLATTEDRPRLQYTEAMINEVLRMSSLANIGLQHSAPQDTQVGGYTIPKGTVVMASLTSIHHDPRYWEDPDKFLPERWLDSQGMCVTKKEGFIPFSVGKRNCIGESLARMELLVFATAIFQNFSIYPANGTKINLSPDPCNPLGHDPRRYDLIFNVRG